MGSILEDPRVQRLIKIQDAVKEANPDADVEIVDADAVYVNFGYLTALVISECEDDTSAVDICVTEWDRTGGVASDEQLCSWLLVEYAPLIVKGFLDNQRRHEEELEEHLAGAPHEHRWSKTDDLGYQVCLDAECGAERPAPRELVDISKFTHMQQVDNDGKPIGDPIPLKKEQ